MSSNTDTYEKDKQALLFSHFLSFFKKKLVCLVAPKLGRGKPFPCQWKPHSSRLDGKKYAYYSSKKSTVQSWAWLFFAAVVLLHYLCRHLSSILSCITGE